MDPNQPAQSSENLPPRKEPHLPISMAETHPEIYNENSTTNSKNTLLTLASLLVLAGIVGITLFLYIQNKSGKIALNNYDKNPKITPQQPQPTLSIEQKKTKYGVICRRFTSIEQALAQPEVTCTLDLSNQGLTEIPKDIAKLSYLQTLNLSNNNITKFSDVLVDMDNLLSVDLSNNNISSAGTIKKPTSKILPDGLTSMHIFQVVTLTGNPISEVEKSKFRSSIASNKIVF
jgi:Leucine-rich repeat (LRR) protein